MAQRMTLVELAKARGVTPDSLRQRVNRGTLKARKVGPLWMVEPREVERVLGEAREVPPSGDLSTTGT